MSNAGPTRNNQNRPHSEPYKPRFIYINPKNNDVHLLMPIVGGTSIGGDNTCKSGAALKEFFGLIQDKPGAKDELVNYKRALQDDLADPNLPTLSIESKRSRLIDIKHYLLALDDLSHIVTQCLTGDYPGFPEPVKRVLQKRSNIYSMVLRPSYNDEWGLDYVLNSQSPIFRVTRPLTHNEANLRPSSLCNIIRNESDGIDNWVIPHKSVRTKFTNDVLGQLGNFSCNSEADLRIIIDKLGNTSAEYLEDRIDFTKGNFIQEITKANIDSVMGFDGDATVKDYLDALISDCAGPAFDTTVESPFNKIINSDNKEQDFLIITQFLLGQINIYCYANGMFNSSSPNHTNFARFLENNDQLCGDLIRRVKTSFTSQDLDIENEVIDFINQNSLNFYLNQEISIQDRQKIFKKYAEDYNSIKDSDHFDEFIIFHDDTPFDIDKQGVVHQSNICIDFTEFVKMCNNIEYINTDFSGDRNRRFSEINRSADTLERSLPGVNTSALLQFAFDNNDSYSINKIVDDRIVNDTDTRGFTPLIWAVRNNNNNLVSRLMNYPHINPNIIYDGHNPTCAIYQAILRGNNQILATILQRGNNVIINKPGFQLDSLNLAINNSNNEAVRLLLSNKNREFDVNFTEEANNNVPYLVTALHLYNFEVANLLLNENNIDPNLCNNEQNNPISLTLSAIENLVQNNYPTEPAVEFLRRLVSHPRININLHKKQLLQLAVNLQDIELIDILMANQDIDINEIINDQSEKTILMLALEQDNYEFTRRVAMHNNTNMNQLNQESMGQLINLARNNNDDQLIEKLTNLGFVVQPRVTHAQRPGVQNVEHTDNAEFSRTPFVTQNIQNQEFQQTQYRASRPAVQNVENIDNSESSRSQFVTQNTQNQEFQQTQYRASRPAVQNVEHTDNAEFSRTPFVTQNTQNQEFQQTQYRASMPAVQNAEYVNNVELSTNQDIAHNNQNQEFQQNQYQASRPGVQSVEHIDNAEFSRTPIIEHNIQNQVFTQNESRASRPGVQSAEYTNNNQFNRSALNNRNINNAEFVENSTFSRSAPVQRQVNQFQGAYEDNQQRAAQAPQAAVNNQLNQLRQLLGDELFTHIDESPIDYLANNYYSQRAVALNNAQLLFEAQEGREITKKELNVLWRSARIKGDKTPLMHALHKLKR